MRLRRSKPNWKKALSFYENEKKLLNWTAIQQRTMYDLEMIREVGICKGIENYSRHFSMQSRGSAPLLLDYFPSDFLFFIDESHQTIPQLHAMYNGDRARKQSLVDFGFRLPSAFDNRPLSLKKPISACIKSFMSLPRREHGKLKKQEAKLSNKSFARQVF